MEFTITLTRRELDTVLAALRNYQAIKLPEARLLAAGHHGDSLREPEIQALVKRLSLLSPTL
jgi:hypothetical protein